MSRDRARIRILSHMAQFSLGRDIGGQAYAGLRDMRWHDETPIPGDLVAIQSCGPSKWYLSWCVETTLHEGGWHHYFLASIEDGAICDWSNVGTLIYNRATVAEHPEWRWDDKQHEFNDRWKRTCRKARDAYIHLPVQAHFDDDNGVTLAVRVRFGMDERVPKRHFPDWRKVTKAVMLEFYDEAEAELNQPLAASGT